MDSFCLLFRGYPGGRERAKGSYPWSRGGGGDKMTQPLGRGPGGLRRLLEVQGEVGARGL